MMPRRKKPKVRNLLSKSERRIRKLLRTPGELRTLRSKLVANPLNLRISDSSFSISGYREGKYVVSGTAICIGPLIALTALHVIDHFFREFDNVEFHSSDEKPSEATTGYAVMLVHNLTGATYSVQKMHFLHGSPDVAILRMSPHNEAAVNASIEPIEIELDPPAIGEQILAFGYVKTKKPTWYERHHRVKYGNGETRVGRWTSGQVVEVFDEQRDTAMLPFPCFQTNARFDHGMSGGPIFNSSGRLIGLVSSSFPSMPGHPEVSFGTLLYPAMLIPFDDGRLLDVVQTGKVIKAMGHQRCKLAKVTEGNHEVDTIEFVLK